MQQKQNNNQLSCQEIGHQNQPIVAICKRRQCDKPSAVCLKCILPFHKTCDGHIIYLEELPSVVNQFKIDYAEIYDKLGFLIQKLKEIQSTFRKSLELIQGYEKIKSVENLNTFGKQIRAHEKIEESVRQGNEVILDIFELWLNPQKQNELTVKQQNEAEEWRQKSLKFEEKKEYQKSIESIEKALSINPKSDVYWNDKGHALLGLVNCEEAIQCFDKAVRINPKNDLAWERRGYALNKSEKYDEAIHSFFAALHANPNNESAWNFLSVVKYTLLQLYNNHLINQIISYLSHQNLYCDEQ